VGRLKNAVTTVTNSDKLLHQGNQAFAVAVNFFYFFLLTVTNSDNSDKSKILTKKLNNLGLRVELSFECCCFFSEKASPFSKKLQEKGLSFDL
jgi:hypothetical protein